MFKIQFMEMGINSYVKNEYQRNKESIKKE